MIGLGNCLESWLSLGGQGPRAIKALKEQSLLPRVVQVGLGRGRADGKRVGGGAAGEGERTHTTLCLESAVSGWGLHHCRVALIPSTKGLREFCSQVPSFILLGQTHSENSLAQHPRGRAEPHEFIGAKTEAWPFKLQAPFT